MRQKVALAIAALVIAGLTSVPASAADEPLCFGHKPDVISTRDRDVVAMGHGRMVAIIKGDYTKVAVGFDSDPPWPNQQSVNPPGVLICVKSGANHVRVTGWVHKLHTGGQDTRLVYSGPCSDTITNKFYRVYQVDMQPCNDDVQGP